MLGHARGGQIAAWGLLVPAATLMVVGFTLESVDVRLSNLMALDARALGNWGCAPELYPEILEKVLGGSIDVVSGTELRPLLDLARRSTTCADGAPRGGSC